MKTRYKRGWQWAWSSNHNRHSYYFKHFKETNSNAHVYGFGSYFNGDPQRANDIDLFIDNPEYPHEIQKILEDVRLPHNIERLGYYTANKNPDSRRLSLHILFGDNANLVEDKKLIHTPVQSLAKSENTPGLH